MIRLAISGPQILCNILPDATELVLAAGTDLDQSEHQCQSPPKPLFPHPNEDTTVVDQGQHLTRPTNHQA